MKIAVTSTLPSLDAPVGTELNDSKYLMIINPDTMEYKVMMNPIMAVGGPAMWELFTQELLQEDVRIILVGNHNSNISKSLDSAGIQIIGGMDGSVRSDVKQFKKMSMADTVVIAIEDIKD